MMKKKSSYLRKISHLGEKGQTAVEYVLMFAVVMVMTLALMKQIKDRMIGDIDNCGANSQSLGCKIKSVFPSGGYNSFRTFKVF